MPSEPAAPYRDNAHSEPEGTCRLRSLFEAALAQPLHGRAGWIAAHIADASERALVQGLLAGEAASGPLDTPLADRLARIGDDEGPPIESLIGQRIGAFRLVRLLGQGGMATVFLGERVGADFDQQVAIKLLSRGLYSEVEQRLFRRERQALAMLSHPHIAHLIDGGVTEAGIPYLVMDYIDGMPITQFAAERRLDLRARLRLFRVICRAVDAAHRQLIVHRDLKPSNILVDAQGEVKLLDFGIAKLLDEDDGATGTGLAALTPDYAAPEQHHGGAITTATDVYALGVVLHELLLGVRPESGTTTKRPSACAAEARPDKSALPASKSALRAALRGDLDNIVLKALAGEPERRYGSAGMFADDIERHLDGRPVAAHPPSRWYRVRKFVRRHRGSVATTIVFVLAILASLGLALWQADVARIQARRANTVRDFLVQVFDAAKTNLPRNQRPTPETLLAEAVKRLRGDPTVDAAVRVDLMRTLGTVSLSMGDHVQAESLLDEAIRHARELRLSPSSPEWIDLLVRKGDLLHVTDRNGEADRLLAGILPQLRAHESQAALDGLKLYSVTRLFAGDSEEAMEIAQVMAAKAARNLPKDSLAAVNAATWPGQVAMFARRFQESVALLEPAVLRWRALGLPQDMDFAQALNNLAVVKESTGEREAAESLYRESVALRRRIYEGPHNNLAMGLERLAIFLTKQEKFDEAHALLQEALAMNRQVLDADSSEMASTLDTLGVLEGAQRRFESSEKNLRQSVSLYSTRVAASGQDQNLAFARNHLAQTLLELGQVDEAQSLNSQALATLRELHGENDFTLGALCLTGRIAMARQGPKAALAISDQLIAQLAQLQTPAPRVEACGRQLRAQALQALGRHGAALVEISAAIEQARIANPDAHARQAALLALRARIERAAGKNAAATATIQEAQALHVPWSLLSEIDVATLKSSAQ